MAIHKSTDVVAELMKQGLDPVGAYRLLKALKKRGICVPVGVQPRTGRGGKSRLIEIPDTYTFQLAPGKPQ